MHLPFHDRREAGRALAELLRGRGFGSDAVVLGVPRGGIPVAYEVALVLGASLDVFIVRKLGVPGHNELAMGAIASGGARVLNSDIVYEFSIPQRDIDRVAAIEGEELARREQAYRDGLAPVPLRARNIVLVDDGLATGASMRAAIVGVRAHSPASVTVAVPVAPPETCADLHTIADEVVCLATPEPFYAVGMWYRHFDPTSDEEVRRLLALAAQREPLSMGTQRQTGE